MNAPRIIGVVVLVAVVGVLGYVLLSGGSEAEYNVRFENASQLVEGNEVQVAGRTVGTVKAIELGEDNVANVRITVSDRYAPLREGTTAVVRLLSLSGIANRSVALDLGPNNAPELRAGSSIPIDKTVSAVDLDSVFNTLDEKTRGDFQELVKGFRDVPKGNERNANETLRYLNPALGETRRLANEVVRDQPALRDFLSGTAEVTTATAAEGDTITSLVDNARETAGAVADEQRALTETLSLLPDTLRKGNTTFVNARGTLDVLDPLVTDARRGTRDLAPFLRELRPLVADARPTIRDLRRLTRTPGADNDLIDLLRATPSLARSASTAFPEAETAARRGRPTLKFIRPYVPELVGWFRDFGTGAMNYDANGHYARIAPTFNAFTLSPTPGGLGALLPQSDRLLNIDAGNFRRCPGGTTAPSADGSSPFRDTDGSLDCNPDDTPAGP